MNDTENSSALQPSMRLSEPEDAIDLREIFYLLLSHVWQILLCTVLCAMVAFGYTKYMITPLYDAAAKIYIVSASNGSVVNLTDLSIGSQLTSDYSQLLLARPLLEDVIDNLDLNMSASQLAGMISITNASDTRILKIGVTSSDPQLAADIANELTVQALIYLPKFMDTTPPNVIEDAIVPTAASSPNYTKNVMLGAVIGFVMSAGYLILRFLMNDTYETPEDLAASFGVMPLAVIPEENIEGLVKREGSRKLSKRIRDKFKKKGDKA
jgi:capsular polysaccharide biosynthesis protein